MNWLLIFVPIAVGLEFLAPERYLLVFLTSALAILPLARWMGRATEQLAERMGEGGFKDRDLYVFCANASDGTLTAHPSLRGELLQDIKGKKGYPYGQEMMQNATEGTIAEVHYWWPRPGMDKPLLKTTFYTKVGEDRKS